MAMIMVPNTEAKQTLVNVKAMRRPRASMARQLASQDWFLAGVRRNAMM